MKLGPKPTQLKKVGPVLKKEGPRNPKGFKSWVQETISKVHFKYFGKLLGMDETVLYVPTLQVFLVNLPIPSLLIMKRLSSLDLFKTYHAFYIIHLSTLIVLTSWPILCPL